jgi:hypothetical protein
MLQREARVLLGTAKRKGKHEMQLQSHGVTFRGMSALGKWVALMDGEIESRHVAVPMICTREATGSNPWVDQPSLCRLRLPSGPSAQKSEQCLETETMATASAT